MNDLEYAVSIIKAEAEAIRTILSHIGWEFQEAVNLCRQCQGNIIVSGVGKSGFIAQKMAATFASIGIKSFWVHPNDADHGDIGRITDKDVCVLFSNSGETKEIINLATQIKSRNSKIISIVGKTTSSLGNLSDVILYLGEYQEAGIVKSIPTSSTTASLAMADALALATVGTCLTKDDFLKNHHGGSIGFKLSSVDDFMRSGVDCVIVDSNKPLLSVMIEMTSAHIGAAIVVDSNMEMIGIITDGDLRRFVCNHDINMAIATDCMTKDPIAIKRSATVEDALDLFKLHSIGDIPIVDDHCPIMPVGILSLKDLTKLSI